MAHCRPSHRLTRTSPFVVLALLLLAWTVPAHGQSCGTPNPWFQPTTVQKGHPFLVTGIEIEPGEKLLFTWLKQDTFPLFVVRYYTEGTGNGNCVHNQEYLDTNPFTRGVYTTNVAVTAAFPPVTYNATLSPLSVIKQTSPPPVVYPPVSCGQPAHAWFGPSVVNRNANMFIAAVNYPGKKATFFFEPSNSPGAGPPALRLLSVGPAAGNCVSNHFQFRAGQFFGPGAYNVFAGFFDENGRYHYDPLGTLTVT